MRKRSLLHAVAAGSLCLIAIPLLHAWGLNAHQMQLRVALRALPRDMPKFFLSSEEALVLLGTEPDRWRTPDTPAATETTGPDHFFSWEIAPKPLPPDRTAFLGALARRGDLSQIPLTMKRFGTSPYAIQEWGEILTGAFVRWREMPEDTEAHRFVKRRHEESILFIAGVLAHWVMDSSQPQHCSVHILGWDPSVPNPKGYTANRDIHGRYETQYVDANITLEDIRSRVTQAPVELGPWIEAMTPYLANCNSHVEEIYRFDLAAPFASGHESPEAKAFTADRLAEGARMLRDVWYTAWVRSGRLKSPGDK